MRPLIFLAVGIGGLTACTSGGPMVEAGYPVGSLGLAAIQRGDWATAEQLLTDEGLVPADDPVRLINLGRVYVETGRTEEALRIWRRALAAGNHHEVELLNGRTASTEQIARAAIAHYEPTLQTAAR